MVSNSGKRGGHHAVDLYVSDLYASLSPAVRKLQGFKKIYLEAGDSVAVSFELEEDDLSFVNADLQRIVEPGEFRVQVGELMASFRYE